MAAVKITSGRINTMVSTMTCVIRPSIVLRFVVGMLFISQCFYRVKIRRLARRIPSEKHSGDRAHKE